MSKSRVRLEFEKILTNQIWTLQNSVRLDSFIPYNYLLRIHLFKNNHGKKIDKKHMLIRQLLKMRLYTCIQMDKIMVRHIDESNMDVLGLNEIGKVSQMPIAQGLL